MRPALEQLVASYKPAAGARGTWKSLRTLGLGSANTCRDLRPTGKDSGFPGSESRHRRVRRSVAGHRLHHCRPCRGRHGTLGTTLQSQTGLACPPTRSLANSICRTDFHCRRQATGQRIVPVLEEHLRSTPRLSLESASTGPARFRDTGRLRRDPNLKGLQGLLVLASFCYASSLFLHEEPAVAGGNAASRLKCMAKKDAAKSSSKG